MTQEKLDWDVVDGGNGPYLFMVHGMLSSRHQWDPNLDALKPIVTPVVFDLWGHGNSPTPTRDEPYMVDYLVGEFERVRNELNAPQIFLCGQSFGAGLTLRYSLTHPERVLGQIFTNSLSALTPANELRPPQDRALRAESMREEGVAGLRKLPFHPRRALRLPDELRKFLVEMADAVDPEAVARISEVSSGQLSVKEDLEKIACPTLLVNGAFEKRFQPLRVMAQETIPGCQVIDIDAGHAVNLEQPRAFDDAVTQFLRGILES